MTDKGFDCVRMKHEIQEGIAEEFKGLSVEERRLKTEAMICADPVLESLWRQAHPIGDSGIIGASAKERK
ncbi:MAG: hypothetical protein FLDDKLPJ_01307 [Phycisphaerae bacterium]|nr:hypothetical protein [Phycisphaerae bacterium]